jgi:hypothetical protein
VQDDPREPTAAEPPGPPPAGASPGGDYGYDLAHEAGSGGEDRSAEGEHEAVYVVTSTQDQEGDYSYDLAHDVPER